MLDAYRNLLAKRVLCLNNVLIQAPPIAGRVMNKDVNMSNSAYSWPEWTQLVDMSTVGNSAKELLNQADMLRLDNRSLAKKVNAKLCIDRSVDFSLHAEIYEIDNGVTAVTQSDMLNQGDFVYLYRNGLFQRYLVRSVRKGARKSDPCDLLVVNLEVSKGY